MLSDIFLRYSGCAKVVNRDFLHVSTLLMPLFRDFQQRFRFEYSFSGPCSADFEDRFRLCKTMNVLDCSYVGKARYPLDFICGVRFMC